MGSIGFEAKEMPRNAVCIGAGVPAGLECCISGAPRSPESHCSDKPTIKATNRLVSNANESNVDHGSDKANAGIFRIVPAYQLAGCGCYRRAAEN